MVKALKYLVLLMVMATISVLAQTKAADAPKDQRPSCFVRFSEESGKVTVTNLKHVQLVRLNDDKVQIRLINSVQVIDLSFNKAEVARGENIAKFEEVATAMRECINRVEK